jgi:hypothetical protein
MCIVQHPLLNILFQHLVNGRTSHAWRNTRKGGPQAAFVGESALAPSGRVLVLFLVVHFLFAVIVFGRGEIGAIFVCC